MMYSPAFLGFENIFLPETEFPSRTTHFPGIEFPKSFKRRATYDEYWNHALQRNIEQKTENDRPQICRWLGFDKIVADMAGTTRSLNVFPVSSTKIGYR
ncbi:hypothetical protein SERLA73DRAFT_69308 [Serpula lacrymans var. lacrymans S7.3]|uniref:Uncharacterized protein n=2 Tax=Serpula lacrymans var. lacrymans TaxID=341189 RepID=F8PJ76_SERL3|nr:uncharacterized protein SERLADRAFT_433199 [Serpula lacrymans var. lacrymans S7.9]EGO03440.1 hypothetical protein SERLA73DRAFT_69308 [Serpula lacrymans var. lacrymans S7.3]EGO29203.1 hypothetical protein SERLADRAFT_433199 [Serpula lacrymans var. lacrymans S7.9]